MSRSLAPIPVIVCVVGFLIWIIGTFYEKTPPHAVMAEAGKWAFILGLGFSLYFYGGR